MQAVKWQSVFLFYIGFWYAVVVSDGTDIYGGIN